MLYLARISGFAPKPPVAITTPLEALSVTLVPSALVALTPTTRPFWVTSSSALVSSMISTPSFLALSESVPMKPVPTGLSVEWVLGQRAPSTV